MTNIVIEYKGKRIKLKHPERFDELTEKQYLAFIEYVYLHNLHVNKHNEQSLLLMQVLLEKSIGKYFKTKWFKVVDDMVKEGVIDKILELQDFVYEQKGFDKWFINVLEIKKTKYYGPKNRFSYMTFGQFIVADILMTEYLISENENLLNEFCAALYLPENKKFATENLHLQAQEFKQIPELKKHGILFNFIAIRKKISEQYPDVFEKESNEPRESSQAESSRNPWRNIRRFIAKDLVNIYKIDEMLVHDVLFDLNREMKES